MLEETNDEMAVELRDTLPSFVAKVSESTLLSPLVVIAVLRAERFSFDIETDVTPLELASIVIELDPDFLASLTNEVARSVEIVSTVAVLLSSVGIITILFSDH